MPSHKIRRVRRNRTRRYGVRGVEYLADWCPAGLKPTEVAELLTAPPYTHPDSALSAWLKARKPA